MKRTSFLGILLMASLLIGGCGGDKKAGEPGKAEYKAQMKLASLTPASHTYNQAANKFAELVKQRSQGRIEVKVYPDGQLGKGERELLEAIQQGTLDIYVGSTAPLSGFSPSMGILDIPFLFRDYAHADKVLDGPIGLSLLKELEKANLKGLAFWDNGFKIMSANKPLKAVEDSKGLKMRIQSSKVLEAEMKALGTNPQVIAFGETYQALQTGVVDGTENPPSNLYTQKMHEVQKNATVTNHGYLGYAVITNKDFWEKLPEDVRKGLDEALKESTDYANQIAKEENEKALEAVKASGKTEVYVPTEDETKAMQKALAPVHAEMAERIGKETIDAVYAATGFDPSK